MNTQLKSSFFVTIVLLIFLLIFLGLALSYGPKERLIPLGVLVPCIVLAVILLLGEKYPKLIKLFDLKSNMLTQTHFKKPSDAENTTKPIGWDNKILSICLWSTGFFVLVFLFGFLIAIPIYLLLFLKLYGNIKWIKAATVALITWGAVYIFFEILLSEELFRGILFSAYVPPI